MTGFAIMAFLSIAASNGIPWHSAVIFIITPVLCVILLYRAVLSVLLPVCRAERAVIKN